MRQFVTGLKCKLCMWAVSDFDGRKEMRNK